MTNPSRLAPLLVLTLFFALAALPALAQSTSRVAGTVTDNSGAVVQGATVTLTNQATGVAVNSQSNSAGAYVFDGIVPGTYSITVSAPGFKTLTSTGNTVTIAQPLVFNPTLTVGATTTKVEVNAGSELVQLETSGDLGALIDQRALTTLPIVGARGRSPLDLLELIPGVVDGGPQNSSGANITGGGVIVNGSRDRAWNYTLDGIDMNETSAPGSNFSPLRTNPDSITGFRVITTNADAQYGVTSGGQVILNTRSGTNNFHGNVFWFYQTPGLNATDPGSKENGQGKPQFIQNILGFSVGGPIIKNKTFFFVNTQFLHTSQDFTTTSIVYTQPARNGLFRYVTNPAPGCDANSDPNCLRNTPFNSPGASVDAHGNPIVPVSTYDVAANDPAHRGLDPSIQKFIGLTPLPNNFTVGDGLNTAGYTFNAPEAERQVDFTVRIDHQFNAHNSIFGRWAHGHQNTVGDTANAGLQPFPGAPNVVNTLRQPRNLAVSWRYTPGPTVTNEVIAGMNRFIFNFINPDPNYLTNPPFVFNQDSYNDSITLPLQNYVGNLRALTTIQFVDNLTYTHGPHTFRFGTNLRYQREVDDRGSIGSYDAQPLVYFNTDVARVNSSTGFTLPNNIETTYDLPELQGVVNNMLGRVGDIQQGFVAQSPTKYAPAGTHLLVDFRMPEYDFYGQDTWKALPNLTLDLGLRWEIKLSPRTPNSNFHLRPNQPFAAGATPSDTIAWVPGQLYKDAWHNLAPSVGFAWDPFKNGKSSVRGNYRLAYDRMNTFVLSSAVFQGLPGETYQLNDQSFGLAGGRVADGLPTEAPPAGSTPLSFRQPPAFSETSVTAVNPNWTPPQVSEWSLSVQRQIGPSSVIELAYIGHHAAHLFGAYDSNQAEINSNGFLQAFNTAVAGGDSPLIDQLLTNDPGRQQVGESGSVYLTDSANNSPYAPNAALGSVAGVAQQIGLTLDSNGVPLPVSAGLSNNFFFRYPQFAGGFDVLDSGDWSNYNAFQASYHGRFDNLTFQAHYTWSKSLDTRSFDPTFSTVVAGSSTFGSSSTPFNINDRKLNYGPSDADRTHLLQGIWTYQVPFGAGQHWGHVGPALDRLVGGWEISGSAIAESGHPMTIFSPAYTLSSLVRTPASCTGCTRGMFKVHYDKTSGTLNYLTPAQIAKFSTPAPGQFSNIGRNYFRLAPYSVLNLSVGKVTRLFSENNTLELRIEMQNALNQLHYDQPASNRIDRPLLGVVDPAAVENAGLSEGSSPRTVQLSAKFAF
jgi:hypothetical protein